MSTDTLIYAYNQMQINTESSLMNCILINKLNTHIQICCRSSDESRLYQRLLPIIGSLELPRDMLKNLINKYNKFN